MKHVHLLVAQTAIFGILFGIGSGAVWSLLGKARDAARHFSVSGVLLFW